MENKICLDSDFLVSLLRKEEAALNWLKNNNDKIFCTTAINVFEIFYGAWKFRKKEQELKACHDLIENLEVLELSSSSGEKAGEIAAKLELSGKKIDFRDIFIASIVIGKRL